MKGSENWYDTICHDNALKNSVPVYSSLDHIDHSLYMNFVYGGLLDNYHIFLDDFFEDHTDKDIGFMNTIIDDVFISDYFHSFQSLSFEEHYSPSLKGFFIDERFVPRTQFTISSAILWHFSMFFAHYLLDSLGESDDALSWSEDDKDLIDKYFGFLQKFPLFAPSLINEYRKMFSNKLVIDEKTSHRATLVDLE